MSDHTTGQGTARLNASETARSLMAILAKPRVPVPPECAVEIGTTAKRIHTWTITVRGDDVGECARKARFIDEALSAHYASEMEGDDNLAARLAASVIESSGGKP